jgi:hypothetical protein
VLLDILDTDGSGEIDVDEFVAFWNNAPPLRLGDEDQVRALDISCWTARIASPAYSPFVCASVHSYFIMSKNINLAAVLPYTSF